MSKKDQRISQILSILSEKSGISIKSMAQELGVSEMTVRRDFRELEDKDYISLIQGVAILNKNQDGSTITKDYTLASERQTMADAKCRIGLRAASLIEPNDIIIIDTGTTTEYLTQFIPSIPLTAVCYTLNNLNNIQQHNITDIIFAGGFYHENTQMFESPEGVSLISRTCANKFFCSAAGISSKGDVTCIDQYEILTKQAALKAALTKILLVDSSKFGHIRSSLFASIMDFDLIITDDGIGRDWIQFMDEHNLSYEIV